MNNKKKAIYVRFNSHDCEVTYKCPYCNSTFSGWTISYQVTNENGTKKYCPSCKKELDGLD